MKITLISLDSELYCFGIRVISACLRKAGHSVQLLFMPPKLTRDATKKFQIIYPQRVLNEVRDICSDSDLIGLSLMTNQLIQAINVTEYLKSHDIISPIIWGGIQPTIEPEVCLEHADIVCIGEGEDAIVELADHIVKGRSYFNTRNMWFNTQNGIVRNRLRPLIQDLDRIPFPDYSCSNHFIANENRVEELTLKKFMQFNGERFHSQGDSIIYMFVTSRGCLFSCTYCCNSAYHSLYPGQRLLRWRSIDNVIGELKMIQRDVAPISYIYMVDDNFTARSKGDLALFCERYRDEIGIPFFAQLSPLTVTEEKMEILFNAGCSKVTVGIETATERIAKMYNREGHHRVLSNSIDIIEKYRPRMSKSPTYQFIIDNPYESLDETLETLRLAIRFPRPWHNPIYSLMLFPGSKLYEQAERDGLIKDKYSQIYGRNWRVQSKPFFQFWIRLYRSNFSPFILRILLQHHIARLLTGNFFNIIWRMRVLKRLWNRS